METTIVKKGDKINYKNGNLSIYTGEIVKIFGEYLTVIDSEAERILYNAGYSVGSYINKSQIIF